MPAKNVTTSGGVSSQASRPMVVKMHSRSGSRPGFLGVRSGDLVLMCLDKRQAPSGPLREFGPRKLRPRLHGAERGALVLGVAGGSHVDAALQQPLLQH